MFENHLENGIIHKRIDNNSVLNSLFIFDQTVGKGTFGTVYKAFSHRTHTDIAIKIVNKEKAGSRGVCLLEHEIEILKIINHPNLIRLYEVYETSQQVFMVMELCHRGQLAEMLNNKGHFDEFETRHVVKQLSQALAYLHKMDIVHRDIKLDNILIQDTSDEEYNLRIKITDFGLAVKVGGVMSEHMLTEFCGTPIYMAPEMVSKRSYSTLCDVWAMGIISYCLLEGQQPYAFKSEQHLYTLIKNGEINYKSTRFSGISISGKKCIQGMLEINPALRLSAIEIFNSSWITGNSVKSESVTVIEMMKQYKEDQMRSEGGDSDENSVNEINQTKNQKLHSIVTPCVRKIRKNKKKSA